MIHDDDPKGFAATLRTAVLFPLHALQILTGNKNFRNALLGSETLNRKGLHIWRVTKTARITAWRRRRLTHLLPDPERAFFARVELYASQRPNPSLPFIGLDSARLPFVSGRKEVIGWYVEDWLVRLGLQRLIWKPVGKVSAREPAVGQD